MKNSDFSITRQYMTYDGKPWFPVMGEMHYSRYREDLWEESLRKMKAAGVQIVSSYMIWHILSGFIMKKSRENLILPAAGICITLWSAARK